MENRKNDWSPVVALGCLWGVFEAGMGMFLRGTCAHNITGSLMTGFAIFFLSAALSISKRIQSVLLMLFLAVCFKLLDAALLGLPVLHGAIGNPIYAFYTEVLAFFVLWKMLDARLGAKVPGQALLGCLTALVAVNLFPLVRFVTGIPACVYPGTRYPLSLYFAPIAIGISAVACPLGMALGRYSIRATEQIPFRRLSPVLVRSIPVISLVLIIVLRLR